MYCSNCGKLIQSDAKFCAYCGATQTNPVEIQQTFVQSELEQMQFQPMGYIKTQRSRKLLIIIVFCIMLLAVGMITVLLLERDSRRGNVG